MPRLLTRTIVTLIFGLLFEGSCFSQVPTVPANFTANGFESHVELAWSASAGAVSYQIYRSADGGATFDFLKNIPASQPLLACDWTGDEGQSLGRQYVITAKNAAGESPRSPVASAQTRPLNDDELLEMTQRATFRYFWEYAHPVSGMARDRNNGDPNSVTTGGTGMGIMAVIVATERGWISRQAAVNQLIRIVSFLQAADRWHGAFPHFMDGKTGNVLPFSQFDDGADLVETAFLMQGLLAARQYFSENTPLEKAVRDVISGLWEDVDWAWFRRNNGPVLYWHWSPNFGWAMNFPLRGFNETHLVYLLAIASPTHPVPASLYTTGWASSGYVNTASHWGYKLYCGPSLGGPLFFAHYSYLGFDPRGRRDQFCNYFVRNRNHTLINRQACIANPEHHQGYAADCWGLTASDDPLVGYLAHDPLPANDNGTLAPTAALSSMPYTPDESMAALRHFYRVRGEKLWGIFGFYDAFNDDVDWVAPSYLAIDEGPIVCMIENHRTGLLWKNFMANPEIQPALDAIGFVPDASDAAGEASATTSAVSVFPNPARVGEEVFLKMEVPIGGDFWTELTDVNGRISRKQFFRGGFGLGKLELAGVARGVYFLKIRHLAGGQTTTKLVLE